MRQVAGGVGQRIAGSRGATDAADSLENGPIMKDSKAGHLSSGMWLKSGRRLESGLHRGHVHPFTSGFGGGGDWLWGDEIEVDIPAAFRLSPRIYALARAECGSDASVDQLARLADLPLHLVFHDSGPAESLRQCWFSDDSSCWKWQLVVEQHADEIVGTLSATPPESVSAKPLVWRGVGWKAFGVNHLQPEQATGTGAVPLCVRVP